MKKLRVPPHLNFPSVFAAMLGLGGLFVIGTVHAAELDWDGNGAATGIGGSGTWDTTTALWRTGTNGTATGNLQVYDNTSPSPTTAYFASTAGTVTLAAGAAINANTVSLLTTGYIINGAAGASITLNGTSPNNPPQVIGPNTGTATVNAVLAGTAGLSKGGSGTLVLGGANTYTGNTLIRGGFLSISSIGTTGSASSNLGAGTGTINFSVSGSVATLIYTGTGETTDRVVNLQGGDGTIQNDGGGALNFTSNMTSTAVGARTFTLTGSSGGTFSGNIVNGSATVALTKSGAGTWTLAGANAYSGATTVNGGILAVDSAGTTTARLSSSAITVNSGTLLLTNSTATASSDRIKNNTAVTLAGGTLASANGANEGVAATKAGGTVSGTSTAGMGMLTLSASSTLDFDNASNGNLLSFSSFSRTAGTLTISNWTNSHFDGTNNSGLATDDRLVFGADQSGNLQYFNFGAGAGVGVSEVLLDTGFYEVGFTSVPEPSACVMTLLSLSGVGLLIRRRTRRLDTGRQIKG